MRLESQSISIRAYELWEQEGRPQAGTKHTGSRPGDNCENCSADLRPRIHRLAQSQTSFPVVATRPGASLAGRARRCTSASSIRTRAPFKTFPSKR
jgi:hypothetical protein